MALSRLQLQSLIAQVALTNKLLINQYAKALTSWLYEDSNFSPLLPIAHVALTNSLFLNKNAKART